MDTDIEMAPPKSPPDLLSRIEMALPRILELNYTSLLDLAGELVSDSRFLSKNFLDNLSNDQCVEVL
jgi:hypothetical protein